MRRKNFLQSLLILAALILLSSNSISESKAIRTPEGNMPLVHWAVVESVDGRMNDILNIGARTLAAFVPNELGTYCLYGGVDIKNQNVMRLLEIYESYEAYRIHSTSEAFQQYRAERLPILKNLKLLEVNAIVLEQKISGVGSIVCMHRYEIDPKSLSEYQKLVVDESIRAVRDDDGVMGIFITAEHDNPNIIHTMEIFKDNSARENYFNSKYFKSLHNKISRMIKTQQDIENLSTKIILSDKGFKYKM